MRARALDLLLTQFPHAPAPAAATDRLPLPGGDIEDFHAFQLGAQRAEPAIDTHALTSLLRNHGAEYWRVLDAANGGAQRARPRNYDSLRRVVARSGIVRWRCISRTL